jgi:hypothetical protein
MLFLVRRLDSWVAENSRPPLIPPPPSGTVLFDSFNAQEPVKLALPPCALAATGIITASIIATDISLIRFETFFFIFKNLSGLIKEN